MPIPLPQLDDRTWKDLVEESRSLIPSLAPEWTDFNASDPGITLVELFAYLAETLLYRVNRVTDASRHAFLKLVNGPAWHGHGDIVADIRATLQSLRHPRLAVTAQDYEMLALTANQQPGGEKVARAHCLTRRNLEGGGAAALADSPGHVTVLVLPATGARPSDALLLKVRRVLEPARLITTRVHVVAPRFAAVGVRITLIIGKGVVAAAVERAAMNALETFFHPLHGGSDGSGWPFGRAVYVSEIYQLLTRVPGVQSVARTVDSTTDRSFDELLLAPADASRMIRNRAGELEAVALQPDELPDLRLDPGQIQVRRPEL